VLEQCRGRCIRAFNRAMKRQCIRAVNRAVNKVVLGSEGAQMEARTWVYQPRERIALTVITFSHLVQ
jgi:hypothetical protein